MATRTAFSIRGTSGARRRTTAPEAPRRKKPRVGFYGCSNGPMHGVGRVVRVTSANGEEPGSVRVDCPACRETHHARPFWRTVTRFDDGKAPDLVLGAS